MAKCFDFAKSADNRITIESSTEDSDDFGGQSENWTTQSTVWASVRPASDYTRFQSDNLQTRVTHVIVIRHQSALADVKETVKMRITLDGRLFDVRAVKNMDDSLKDYGKAYQVIMADEAGPDV